MFTDLRIRKQAQLSIVLALSLFLVLLVAACGAAGEADPTSSASSVPSTPTLLASPTATDPVLTETPAPQSREEIESYTVRQGDTLSGIAAQFGLQPETLLWANYDHLRDNPDWLMLDMELLILPVDGVYHQAGGGETLTNIANFFAADVQGILDWPGNELAGPDAGSFDGQWLIVPGGRRLPRFRSMPNVARSAAELDIAEYGSGACPANYNSEVVGSGQYAWPVSSRAVAPESFHPDWHPGLDLAATLGERVLAADDGVVVFSGWSNLGYGYMIMLDHGNGDYSLYAGLEQVLAECGREVLQGEAIGLAGISNHPAGPFVHFEVRRGNEFLDPLDLLPAE